MAIERDEELEKIVGPLCRQLMEEEGTPGGGLQGGSWRQKKESELREVLYRKPQQEQIERGMGLIDEYLPRSVAKETELLVREEAGRAAEKMGEVMAHLMDHEELQTLAEQLGLSGDTLEAIYTVGSHLFGEGRYREAADVYFVCVLMDPLIVECWQALGLSYQQCGNLEMAEDAFRFGYSILPDDPINALYFINSLILNDHWNEAESLAKIAESLLRQNPQGREWEDYLLNIKQRIKNRR